MAEILVPNHLSTMEVIMQRQWRSVQDVGTPGLDAFVGHRQGRICPHGCAERDRLRPISTSASFFDFGQFRLRPISTSANFDFGQFLDVEGRAPKGGVFVHVWSSRAVVRAPAARSGGAAGVSHAAEGCPAEGCPAEGSSEMGCRVRGGRKHKSKEKKRKRKKKQSKHHLFDFGQLITTSANYDFGQLRLRPISTSASFFEFGQFRLRAISTSANFDFGQFLDVKFLDHQGWRPRGWRP